MSEKVRALSHALAAAQDDETFFHLVTDHYRRYGVGTVSYTHLDVYKRQEMNRLRKRLERQQAQWENLCREMGRTDLLEPAFPPEVLEQVRQYKAQGKTTRCV